MDLDTLKTQWKALDERLSRIEQLQGEANAIERARDAEARAQAGLLASRRALRPLLAGLGLQGVAGLGLLAAALAFWTARLEQGAHLVVYGVLVQAYAVALIASAGHEIALIRRVQMGAAVLEVQRALATLRRWRETAGWALGLAGGLIWVPLLLMGFALVGVDLWAARPDLVAWWTASAVFFTGLIGAGLRWLYRHPRAAASLQADPAGQSVRRAELALADLRAFEGESR